MSLAPIPRVRISATSGEGVPELLEALDQKLDMLEATGQMQPSSREAESFDFKR